jgi:hypothetical protein
LLESFAKTATPHRHHRSFTPLPETLKDLKHVAALDLFFQGHLQGIDAECMGVSARHVIKA